MNETPDNILWVKKKDAMGFLTIHYPEKRNALTLKLLMEIHNTLDAFSQSGDVRCVVITGSGSRVFSSGYDIGAIPATPLSNAVQATPDIFLKAFDAIKKFPYPTIAMLNGPAFGAGFNLCACCDIRIAADHTRLGMTAARLGVPYHPEGIQQFIEAFGIARTKEIFFTANIFEGSELLQKGLVDYLIPKPELEEFTHRYARKIIRNAPLSLKGIKKIITMFENNMALEPESLEQADHMMQDCFKSEDLKEGQAAFLEKRMPRFKGK